MLRLRSGSLAPIAAVLAAACTQSQPSPGMAGRATAAAAAPIATFSGEYDPVTGKLSIRADAPSVALPDALSVVTPWADGVPNSSPDNTFEMFTDPGFTPTTVVAGCDAGPTGNSFEGDITIRSWFRNQPLRNVFAELTTVSPSNFTSCNSTTTNPFGLNTASGLWSYGDLDPVGLGMSTVTRRWKFNLRISTAFTFTGRIWAELGSPVTRSADPTFTWAPTYLTTPTRRFTNVATTTGHFTWNGTTFVDGLGKGITFATYSKGSPGGTPLPASVNLTGTAEPYADFSGGTYYVASAAGNASKIDTSGDFTVCVKFKPGAHPGLTGNPPKALVGKGLPEGVPGTDQGWSLVQLYNSYGFEYLSSLDGLNTRSDAQPGYDLATGSVVATQPQLWTTDYMCGGRNTVDPAVDPIANGTTAGVMVGLHGRYRGGTGAVKGTLTSDASLPLVIGAYADGSSLASDAGVYEVIFDSRPATPDVMNEIVSLAEGRALPNWANPAGGPTAQTYLEPFWVTTPVPAFNSTTTVYQLAPYLTVPYLLDGSGLLVPGVQVEYTRPFTGDTTTTGYCVGAELVADLATNGWFDGTNPLVTGDFLQLAAPGGRVATLWIANTQGFNFGASFGSGASGVADWSGMNASRAHRFLACVDPQTATTPSITVFIDGAKKVQQAVGSPAFSLGATDLTLGIGNGTGGNVIPALSGARIRRVVICPSNDPVPCQ